MGKKGKYYINNKEFFNEILTSRVQDKLTDRAVSLILLLAERRSATKFFYIHESDRYTCMSQGIEDSIKYWRTFNPEKSENPFAFFTSVIDNGMKKQFNSLYKLAAKDQVSLSNIYNF